MAKRTAREPEQFEYRVRKTVDCIVTVEALNMIEADSKARDGDWSSEQDLEMVDWELRGRA